MEIGPIVGIRPIAMIKPSNAAPDLSGIFAVEFRKQARDEAPAHQRAARGLEDEESEDASSTVEEEGSPEEIALDLQSPSSLRPKVSFFA
jgi:hypothetical protein